eukprot:2563592-Ditylum_brightwellii.AAC.1
MALHMESSGTVDLVNTWSAWGRTRHLGMYMFFLRNLKVAGIIKLKWKKGDQNLVEMFTKKLAGPAFIKCSKFFLGEDQYSKGRN